MDRAGIPFGIVAILVGLGVGYLMLAFPEGVSSSYPIWIALLAPLAFVCGGLLMLARALGYPSLLAFAVKAFAVCLLLIVNCRRVCHPASVPRDGVLPRRSRPGEISERSRMPRESARHHMMHRFRRIGSRARVCLAQTGTPLQRVDQVARARLQSRSTYFVAFPLAFSTGYFSRFCSSLIRAAARMSMSSVRDKRRR